MLYRKLILCAAVVIFVVTDALPHKRVTADRVITVTNGSKPYEKLVTLENVGEIPHKVDVRFDFLDLPTGSSKNAPLYVVTDLNEGRVVSHPKDSFGANVMPKGEVRFNVIRIEDGTCLHFVETAMSSDKCFEACGSGAFQIQGFKAGKCPTKYTTVDEETSVEECRDGQTNLKYCPGDLRVELTLRTRGVSSEKEHRRQMSSPIHYISNNMDSRASAALNSLNTGWYNNASGLWDSTVEPNGAQWWNSANSLEIISNYEIYGGAVNYSLSHVIANTFEKTTMKETLTGRYDDEGWWCLAWIRAYELTGQHAYLTRAEAIFHDLAVNAWDDTCGGGVWWSYAKGYKNAITNELFLMMAIRLYKYIPTGTVSGKDYLSWAQTSWEWFNASGMINKHNLVNDGLVYSTCVNNGHTEWTYNQGVLLGGLAYLYQEIKDEKLLDSAMAIAAATTTTLVWPSGVLKESCDDKDGITSCDLDQQQFKGVFVRYLNYLLLSDLPQTYASQKKVLTSWIALNSETIWGTDRDVNHLSEVWDGKFGSPGAVMQTSATDAIIAKSALFPPAAGRHL